MLHTLNDNSSDQLFKNEPLTDFSIRENRELFGKTLRVLKEQVESNPLKSIPIVDGEELPSDVVVARENPANPEQILGRVHYARIANARLALKKLKEYAPQWEAVSYKQRAKIISAVAELMRQKKLELASLMVLECGKPWRESDADVAEAIDFCDYYAQEMLRIGEPRTMGNALGEINQYFYQPRGIVSVISPWNFPLAITAGMTTAALVTGNVVALKPAEQSSLIAAELVKILFEAGLPQQALAFLPGKGEQIGAELVSASETDMICFTGSGEVGLQIIEKAAKVRPQQKGIKRVVAEMGGKNAIIVDEDADLDEAIKGVIYSSFGFAGQKCSACSRVIVVGSAYEPFIERFSEACKDVVIGDPFEPATLVGPLIDMEAKKNVLEKIEQYRAEHEIAFEGEHIEPGYFIAPTVFRDVPFKSFLWETELFAPVVACTSAKDFEEALMLANRSKYALTGALFSRSPKNIEQATKQFKVGNLYINRGSTGALVYRQAFGGFKLSGVGSKAGGPDYLVQFMEPRVITENTMRRGFAPELT